MIVEDDKPDELLYGMWWRKDLLRDQRSNVVQGKEGQRGVPCL